MLAVIEQRRDAVYDLMHAAREGRRSVVIDKAAGSSGFSNRFAECAEIDARWILARSLQLQAFAQASIVCGFVQERRDQGVFVLLFEECAQVILPRFMR